MLAIGRRLVARASPTSLRLPLAHTTRALYCTNADTPQWNDLNNVVKELRRIAHEQGLDRGLPDTKLLKELGHKDLVLAIRKKHGGFVSIAAKFGVHVDKQDVDIQKKISSRANRRKKREMRVAKHDFY